MNLSPELVLGSPSGRSILFQRTEGPRKKEKRPLSFNQAIETKQPSKNEPKTAKSASTLPKNLIDKPNTAIYSKRKVMNASLSRSDVMEEKKNDMIKYKMQSLAKSRLVRNPGGSDEKSGVVISTSYDGNI